MCAACGYLEDWTDCPLEYKCRRGAKQSPEEIVYWRRQKGADEGSGPVPWHSIEKTNLKLNWPGAEVDAAHRRLTAPDPHRMTGWRRTMVETAVAKAPAPAQSLRQQPMRGGGSGGGAARTRAALTQGASSQQEEEEEEDGDDDTLTVGSASLGSLGDRSRGSGGGGRGAFLSKTWSITGGSKKKGGMTLVLSAAVGDGGAQRVLGEDDVKSLGAGSHGGNSTATAGRVSAYTDQHSWNRHRRGFDNWARGVFDHNTAKTLPLGVLESLGRAVGR